jgi:hypothetical protein
MSAFAGEPQPVEVFHRGVWYRGELLGWRHEDGGRCLARVRCVVDGLRHSAWMDLADLRLPARPAPKTSPSTDAPVRTTARPRVPQPAPGRHLPANGDTQPHVLLAVRSGRPRPPSVPEPPRYPGPAVHQSDGRVTNDRRGTAGDTVATGSPAQEPGPRISAGPANPVR